MNGRCSFFRFSFISFLLLLYFCNAWGFITHQKFQSPSITENILDDRYIVQVGHASHVAPFVDTLTQSFAQHIQIKRRFTHSLFSGVSFTLNASSQYNQDLHALFNHNNVTAIYPCRLAFAPTLHSVDSKTAFTSMPINASDIISPHRLTQVDRVHKALNYTGKGVLIGIIDSGVDYYHPALGGGFGDGYKVRMGADLVGDEFNNVGTNPIIKPGPTPLDTCGPHSGSVGHGTHVAGIVAGKAENFTGVAPDATLGVWRIFGCSGGTSDDIIVQALLEAEKAGCDIINLSIGDMNGWSETVTSIVASNIAKRGIHVINSCGNNGLSGAFTIGSPSTGTDVVSVGSFDNEYNLVPHFRAVGTSDKTPYHTATGFDETFPPGDIVLGDNDDDDGCAVSALIKGNYALVKEGSCPLKTKVGNIAQAGAIGMVVYNDAKDYAYRPIIHNTAIPVLGVPRIHGHNLMHQLVSNKTASIKLRFLGPLPSLITSAKTVSIFSSVGATFELDLRPHLAGIGGSVYSLLPRSLGSWGFLSGSSMASPYVAGSVALYLNSLGNKTSVNPKVVLERLQNYAYKAPTQNGKDNLDSPLRQGAGLVQVYDAITQTVHVSPGYISFNDTSSTQYKTHTLHITNDGEEHVSYHLFNNVSLGILPYNLAKNGYAYSEPINYTIAPAKLRFSKKFIKLSPGKSIKIKVTVIPPDTDPKQHVMYGGYIQLKSGNHSGTLDLSVPYFGVSGKQKDLPVLDSSTPFILDGVDSTIIYGTNDTLVFNQSSINDQPAPQLAIRFLTGTRRVLYELVDIINRTVIGYVLPPSSYLPRNTLGIGTKVYIHPLQGVYYATTRAPSSPSSFDDDNDNDDDNDHALLIPPGTYRIRIRALHLFGNPNDSNDYELRETGNIQIVE
ncbi:hypothetical protein [Absidia glauca]|uniref:Peptidase S8/S53 domain-containing protein n=1 Tax=Absidia glauca TaxID=4829 RepID=A0A163K2L8_ABSGL|nr:hypothetical protein [Absidia glauca]